MLTKWNLILVAAMFSLATSAVYAHGGTYTGPGGGGTPGYDGPAGGGTQGPGTGGPGGGGGQTGGPGGGSTGGGTGPVGPVRPAGPAPAGGGTGGFGGATGGPAKKASGPSYTNWDWWWDLNEERFLNLKNAVRNRDAATDDQDEFVGKTEGGDDIAAITLRQIRAEILPALLTAVKDSYYDTRAAAVIAIGKVGEASNGDLIEVIKAAMKDKDERVQESCCLALGILGSKAVVPFLLQVAQGDKKIAQEVFGRSDILVRTRMWASVGIGLIGHREPFSAQDSVVQELIKMARTQDAQRDLQVGPAIALQLMKIEDNVPAMLQIAKDEKIDEYVRAHVIVGLGKIGAKSVVPELVELLNDKDNHVCRSAAIALGLLTEKGDKKTIAAIERQARDGKEVGLRNFSMIALGEIGDEKGLATLLEILTKGKSENDKTFSAIAIGLMGFKHQESTGDAAKYVHQAWKTAKSEMERSALAISMALLGYKDALPEMRAVLDEGGKQKLKTYVCTALGLLGDTEALPKIRELVGQQGDPDLRRAAAVALGLMRDTQAVEVLQKVIRESEASKAILGAATVALGYVGDRSAVPILTDYVTNPNKHQDVSRAFAAVALGFLGDKDPLPMLSLIHENSNYLAQSGGLAELLSIL